MEVSRTLHPSYPTEHLGHDTPEPTIVVDPIQQRLPTVSVRRRRRALQVSFDKLYEQLRLRAAHVDPNIEATPNDLTSLISLLPGRAGIGGGNNYSIIGWVIVVIPTPMLANILHQADQHRKTIKTQGFGSF